MKKVLIAATAAVAIVGASAAGYHAYARYDDRPRAHFTRISPEDLAAYADARIAALKAGLRLTAEQQQFWPPVEQALNQLAQKRIERQIERRADWRERREERRERGDRWREERRNPVERLRELSDRLSETGADLDRLADALDPLYSSLDDAQKRRFQQMAAAGERMRRFHRWRDRDDDDRRPRWRERLEWQEDAPQGAERL
jgi:hypothetical protein